jgi:methanogenic corrinoid protein MtbC1
MLRASSRAYASAAVGCMQCDHPQLVGNLPATFADPLADTQVRILHLAESVCFDRPALIEHSVAWYKVALHHRGVPPGYLSANLDAIGSALRSEMAADLAKLPLHHLQLAGASLERASVDVPSQMTREAPHGELAMRFLLAILEGRGDDAMDLLQGALGRGVRIEDLHDHVLGAVQNEVGRMWLMGEVPIADEHYGSAIVDRALWLLQDRVPRAPAGAPHVLTLGVGGNLHDFGMRIVAQRLQLAGFAVKHLGANMPASDLEWALSETRTDLVAISATLALHLHTLAETVAEVRRLSAQRTGNPRVSILVGGPPFAIVPDMHPLVGADAGATDARSAVAAARRLLQLPA